ncbi:MAG TPA: TA system VapC family ribonuclease toxin [Burkholderiales bacterium]
MSFAIDVNLLLYASDAGSTKHVKAREFIETAARGTEVFCFAWATLLGYLRMATHPSIFTRPLAHDEAAGNVAALLALPQVRVLAEEEGFWPVYREVTAEVPTRGNLVPDAHLAALLRQHGVKVLYTHDRDFRKFSFLEVRDPLA